MIRRAIFETKAGIKLLISSDYNPSFKLVAITTHNDQYISNNFKVTDYFEETPLGRYKIKGLLTPCNYPTHFNTSDECFIAIKKDLTLNNDVPLYWYHFS